MKKTLAAILTLCLLLCGALTAWAEAPAAEEALPEASADAAGDDAALPGEGEEEEEDFDPADVEEIMVDELISVDDYAINDALPDTWTNILLLGTDSRTAQQYSRTDTMIILSINPRTSQARLTSIMRDTWVHIPNHGEAKLNAACVYGGPEMTMRCVNENFGMNIQYYVLVNMQCMVEIVDSLGGITLEVTPQEASAVNQLIASDATAQDATRNFVTAPITSGDAVLLNGKQALAYARIRKSDSDYARTARQRKVLFTIARQMQGEDLVSLAGVLANVMPYVETNLSFRQVMELAGVGLTMNVDELREFRVPADGTFSSGTYHGTWCIRPNFEENARLLREFIYAD